MICYVHVQIRKPTRDRKQQNSEKSKRKPSNDNEVRHDNEKQDVPTRSRTHRQTTEATTCPKAEVVEPCQDTPRQRPTKNTGRPVLWSLDTIGKTSIFFQQKYKTRKIDIQQKYKITSRILLHPFRCRRMSHFLFLQRHQNPSHLDHQNRRSYGEEDPWQELEQ